MSNRQVLLDLDELVLARAQADLLGMARYVKRFHDRAMNVLAPASREIRTCVLLSHGRLVGAAGSSAYHGNLEVLNQIRQGMVTRSQAEEIHKVSVIRSSQALVNSACDLLRP